MDETTFLDVASEPAQLPPLPSGALDLERLTELAVGALAVAGATPEDILTTYADTPMIWPLPPRLLAAGRTMLSAQAYITDRPVGPLLLLHRDCRALVRRLGVGPVVMAKLAEGLGTKVRHPFIFSESEPSDDSVNLFSLEFILATGGRKSDLILQDNSISKEFHGKRSEFSRINLMGKGEELPDWKWLQSKLYGNRGTALYSTLDIFDRCQLWVEQNLHKSETAGLMGALSWLKASQCKQAAYDFEQAVVKMEPVQIAPAKCEFARLIYTDEALQLARDLWLDQSIDTHSAFRDFYGYIVPTYIDDGQFRSMFKTGMVLREDFTDDIRKKVDAGMLNFVGWFLRVKRKLEK